MILNLHYSDIIMTATASQITSLTIVYSTVYSDADQRKHQVPRHRPFVRGIQRWPVKSLHKGPETRKMFTFDDVIDRKVIQSFELGSSQQGAYQQWKIRFVSGKYEILVPFEMPIFPVKNNYGNSLNMCMHEMIGNVRQLMLIPIWCLSIWAAYKVWLSDKRSSSQSDV